MSWPGSSATWTGTGRARGCPASPTTSSSTGSSSAAHPAPAGRPTSGPGTRGRSPSCTAWAASSPTTGSSTSRGRARPPGRSPAGAPGTRTTRPASPHVLGPYLHGALFYVSTAAADILAATEELAQLTASPTAGPGEALSRLADFIALRRAQGRGLPATTEWTTRTSGLGVNITLIARLARVHRATVYPPAGREMIRQAAAEIGTEPGGMDTPVSPDPSTGKPWRGRFCPRSLMIERTRLVLASYSVTAYLSGMRTLKSSPCAGAATSARSPATASSPGTRSGERSSRAGSRLATPPPGW